MKNTILGSAAMAGIIGLTFLIAHFIPQRAVQYIVCYVGGFLATYVWSKIKEHRFL